MFAKKFRLPPTVSLDHAQFFSSSFFSLKVQENEYSYNRYGFVVSKKISKRAHVRNRTKRKLRACIERLHTGLLTGYDMLFVVKQPAVSEESAKLCVEVKKILQRFSTIS